MSFPTELLDSQEAERSEAETPALALLGGEPAIKVPLPDWPQYGEVERELLEDVLTSGSWWRASGNQVKRFEKDFAVAHGGARALAVTNGTHAIELALRVLGIGPGDEVIVPSLTFVATAMPVFSVGALPVPVDVRADTWCIDSDAVRAAITPHTRAVMPVHFAGHPADFDALLDLCAEFDVALIEDAAHAHGARWRGRPVGGWGDMGAFSFQNFKLLTAGEGGILVFREGSQYDAALTISNCGRAPETSGYVHDVFGSNYRMSEFLGAVLNGQLTRLEYFAERRAENAERLTRGLAEVAGIRPQAMDPRVDRHARYMYVFTLDPEVVPGHRRDGVVEALVAEGVPAFVMYPRIQDCGFFAPACRRIGTDPDELPGCPISARLAEQGIWLHHRVLLGDEDLVDQVVEALAKVCRCSQLPESTGVSG